MEQLETLKRQIGSATELQSLVRIMKTLASVRVREYGETAASLVQHEKTIGLGLQVVMKNAPTAFSIQRQSGGKVGVILFGSDQGLSGRFNEIVADYAVGKMAEIGASKDTLALLVIGSRAAYLLEQFQRSMHGVFPFVGDLLGAQDVLVRILTEIEDWRQNEGIGNVFLFYGRPEGETSFGPFMQRLLPVDETWLRGLSDREWPCRTLPTYTIDRDSLFSTLIRHHLFLSLYRAIVDSLVSENISRLNAMQAAARNIDERLDDLKIRYNRIRQVAITSELLDIVTGYEALTGGVRGSSARV